MSMGTNAAVKTLESLVHLHLELHGLRRGVLGYRNHSET